MTTRLRRVNSTAFGQPVVPLDIGIIAMAAGSSAFVGTPPDEVRRASNAGNSPDWVIAALGIMAAGGAVTGASPLLKINELARQLKITRARFLITTPPLLPIAREAAAECGGIDLIVAGGTADNATSTVPDL